MRLTLLFLLGLFSFPVVAADATAIAQGLKEALSIGAGNASSALSKTDAFYKSAFRIPFPPEAKIVETTLKRIGMGAVVDQVVLSLNRAAEASASQAKPIFLDAIKSMSINDAVGILRGNSTAATVHLRGKTQDKLKAAFRPTVKDSLDKVDATRYWSAAMNAYNQVPFTKKVEADLTSYVTGKALDAMFVKVGEEEGRIRANPTARVTDLLRGVFGR